MKKNLFLLFTTMLLLASLAFPVFASANTGSPNTISLVSISSASIQGNNTSEDPALSADGRYAAFRSPANNLVDNDNNGKIDIFVRNLRIGTTVRVSVDSGGTEANDNSYFPALSETGRFVAFLSEATNLVANDTNGLRDIFVHDRDTDGNGIFDEAGAIRTVRVSVSSAGTQGIGTNCSQLEIPSISGDGRFVAFHSCLTNLVANDSNGLPDAFVHDRDADGNGIFDEASVNSTATYRVSVDSNGVEADGPSFFPILSGNGRLVIYRSLANNLVPDDSNGANDVFLHNLQTHATTRISVASDGTQAEGESLEGDISLDGHFIVFSSDATNLVPGDTNGSWDTFLRNTQTNEITRISITQDGGQGNGDSYANSISADGRFIVFDSTATNLVSGDTTPLKDVYVITNPVSALRRVSISSEGIEGNGDSESGIVSDDGLVIIFRSNADNLVSNDMNGGPDIFLSQIKLFLPMVTK